MIIRHQNVLRTMREINVQLPHARGWSRTSLPVVMKPCQARRALFAVVDLLAPVLSDLSGGGCAVASAQIVRSPDVPAPAAAS